MFSFFVPCYDLIFSFIRFIRRSNKITFLWVVNALGAFFQPAKKTVLELSSIVN